LREIEIERKEREERDRGRILRRLSLFTNTNLKQEGLMSGESKIANLGELNSRRS
jgi:hypothetical protein